VTGAGADVAKAALLLFVVAIVQVSLLSAVSVGGGHPDLLLVTLVAVALLRGSMFGAIGGFFGGLLVDVATLGTLGLTSLVLTVGGYWIGRYGETTGRDRTHAPYVSVAVVTMLYSIGAMVLHFLLAEEVSARLVIVDSLVPTIAFNLILTAPVYWLVRKLLRPVDWTDRAREVRLLG
jgi:rod shape-determining protein MreD